MNINFNVGLALDSHAVGFVVLGMVALAAMGKRVFAKWSDGSLKIENDVTKSNGRNRKG